MSISNDSIVFATRQQVSCVIDSETVVLHFDKGVYFGLNDVGTIVWNKIQSPCSVSAVRDAIMQEYDVPQERCEQDLRTLLEQLFAQGLVEVQRETAH